MILPPPPPHRGESRRFIVDRELFVANVEPPVLLDAAAEERELVRIHECIEWAVG